MSPNWSMCSSPNSQMKRVWKWRVFPCAREAQAKIAQTLVKSTAAVCGALGAQPIPLADLPFLLTFQLAMVSGIIYISGREMSLKLGTEFLGTMGINFGLGLALREGARAAIRAASKTFAARRRQRDQRLCGGQRDVCRRAGPRWRTTSRGRAWPTRDACSNVRNGPDQGIFSLVRPPQVTEELRAEIGWCPREAFRHPCRPGGVAAHAVKNARPEFSPRPKPRPLDRRPTRRAIGRRTCRDRAGPGCP